MTSKRLTDRARFHGISRSLAADGSTKLDAVLYRRDAETLASRKRIKLVFPRMFPAQVERSREESSAKSRLSNQINRRLCLTVDRGFEIESNLSLPLSWWIVMPTPRLVSRHIRRIDLIRQSSPANGWRGNWLNHPNPWRIGDAAQYSIETRRVLINRSEVSTSIGFHRSVPWRGSEHTCILYGRSADTTHPLYFCTASTCLPRYFPVPSVAKDGADIKRFARW